MGGLLGGSAVHSGGAAAPGNFFNEFQHVKKVILVIIWIFLGAGREGGILPSADYRVGVWRSRTSHDVQMTFREIMRAIAAVNGTYRSRIRVLAGLLRGAAERTAHTRRVRLFHSPLFHKCVFSARFHVRKFLNGVKTADSFSKSIFRGFASPFEVKRSLEFFSI